MNDSNLHPITVAILSLVKGMCLKPDELKHREIKPSNSPERMTLIISPHMADFRIVCGKGGRQINALRWIVTRVGRRVGLTVDIRLEESYRGEPETGDPFKLNPNFEKESDFSNVFGSILALVFDKAPDFTVVTQGDKTKIFMEVDSNNPDDVSTVTALADIFYPFGFRHGRRIDIRPSKLPTQTETLCPTSTTTPTDRTTPSK